MPLRCGCPRDEHFSYHLAWISRISMVCGNRDRRLPFRKNPRSRVPIRTQRLKEFNAKHERGTTSTQRRARSVYLNEGRWEAWKHRGYPGGCLGRKPFGQIAARWESQPIMLAHTQVGGYTVPSVSLHLKINRDGSAGRKPAVKM